MSVLPDVPYLLRSSSTSATARPQARIIISSAKHMEVSVKLRFALASVSLASQLLLVQAVLSLEGQWLAIHF